MSRGPSLPSSMSTPATLSPRICAACTAVRAARTMGLNIAGVDLLRSNHGPVVLEVNSSPGLEGIEGATGLDVAGRIVEFLEKVAAPGKTRDRGRG